jgi:CHAT domain-containing protein
LEVDLLRTEFASLVRAGQAAAARALAEESLEAVDRDRALGFQEWRAEYFEEHSDTELAHLLASSSTLYHDMAERRFELAVREDRGGTGDSRAKALREDIAKLRVRLDLITSEIAARSGGVSGSRTSVDGPAGTVSRVARTLQPGQAIVEYWLGKPRAYAWVIRSTGVEWFELPATEDIEHAARALHEAMHSTAVDPEQRVAACVGLYRLIFAPLSESLGAAKELIVIPDGSLHYVPFAALRRPDAVDRAYLVQDFDLSIAPSLRFLPKKVSAPTPAAQATAKMLMVADPIYSPADPRRDPSERALAKTQPIHSSDRVSLRVNEPATGLVRLESSAREAAQIRDLFGAGRVDLLQGENATRDTVLARDLGRYRFIHIASHGVIDSEIPQLSALILGTYGGGGPVPDPYLRAADLLTKTLHAQAVVLSACDTALGKEYASEGLVGLRYAALARGAHAVVASLWPVTDALASRLVTDMYRGIIASDDAGREHVDAGGLVVARALAGAMRAQLAEAPALDPALWAPFVAYVASD